MKITILVDNSTLIDRYFEGEPGFSALVEHDGKKILFDLGYSDLFLRNACRMGIDLFDLDYVALSHGHLDHTGGLFHLLRHYTHATIERRPFRVPTLVAHPHALLPRPKSPLPDIGAWLSGEEIGRHLPLALTKTPFQLGSELLFLGEIPRSPPPGDEGRKIVLPDGRVEPDRLRDDTALAYPGENGLVILTGCSHSGIGNIVKRAQELTGMAAVDAIVGGLHIAGPSQALREATELFRHLGLRSLYACHCTSWQAKMELSKVAPVKEAGVGLTLEFG